MKILLMEDDLILNEIIQEHLEEKNYHVISTYSGDEAQEFIYKEKFDLLLLDVNVPNINGFELLKDLRKNSIKTPAIFITSLDMVDDIEKGFDSGCDDYIKKPFELKELDIRINNIKRLLKIENSEVLKVSDMVYIDKKNLMIMNKDKNTHISLKELNVLEYLLKNRGTPVSVEELSMNVWSYENAPVAPTIRTYIKNLRKILGKDSITTIKSIGYKLNF